VESKAAVRRWRQGQQAAADRQRELMRTQGPDSDQAVAEALAALDALEAMGMWPGPRDPLSEQAVEVVRRRWARIQTRAKEIATSRAQ
jgi:hypothetical protein